MDAFGEEFLKGSLKILLFQGLRSLFVVFLELMDLLISSGSQNLCAGNRRHYFGLLEKFTFLAEHKERDLLLGKQFRVVHDLIDYLLEVRRLDVQVAHFELENVEEQLSFEGVDVIIFRMFEEHRTLSV